MKKFFDLQKFTEVVSLTSGDDYFDNSDSDRIIYTLAGKDRCYNRGKNVTIYGGDGDDNISNLSDDGNVVIFGNEDDDSISSVGKKNVTISGGDGDDYLWNNSTDYAKISGDSGNDYLYNAGENVTMSGGSGKDTLYNSLGENDYVSGGADNDSIKISTGKRITVSGGTGNDIIYFTGGQNNHYDHEKKCILKYSAGDGNDTVIGFGLDDTLQITSGSYTTTKSGDDIIIKIGSGSITFQKAEEGKLNIVSSGGGGGGSGGLLTGLTYNDDKTEITASKKFKGSAINLTKYPKVKNLNASDVTKKLKITGNSLDNSIQGGSKNDTISGGKGNDTLIGGAGNDILTGGVGEDIFIHSKGKDVITDYAEGEDVIKLQNSNIKSWKISGKNVIFTTTKGQITVKNGKGKEITITETKTYNSSSSALFAENNFVTADNLSEIVKNDLTATDYKIDTQNFENLTQKNNLITFAEK